MPQPDETAVLSVQKGKMFWGSTLPDLSSTTRTPLSLPRS
jgi:hypothetical protein